MKKNKCSSVAVAGAGYWGINLIRNFSESGALQAVCDENPASIKQIQQLYPSCDYIYSFEDVLERKDIPAIVIATPAETHFELAQEALLAGKHVFVEKPLTLSGKDND